MLTIHLRQTEMIQVDTTEISQFEVESHFHHQMVRIFHNQVILECLNDFKSHQAEHEHSDDGQKHCELFKVIEDELIYISIEIIESQHSGQTTSKHLHKMLQHQALMRTRQKQAIFGIGM